MNEILDKARNVQLERRQEKQRELKKIGISMPERFGSIYDYWKKIDELIDADKKVEKLQSRQTCEERDVQFKFIFRKDITCKLDMYVPKIH